MAVRLPSLSASFAPPLEGFAICNSRGRRVSLLNDDDESFVPHSLLQPQVPLQYPPSPTQSSASEVSELSSNSASYSNRSSFATSPSVIASSPQLPPITDLISFNIPNYDLPETLSRKSSVSSASGYSGRVNPSSTGSRRGSVASNSSRSTNRRYECATCGKTFTTSGHVARHNRIHTGEKNFQCPELGCSQRFSRQDNCMQHYRTHKSHAVVGMNTTQSARRLSQVEPNIRNKRRRHENDHSAQITTDPNDRLSALATYISVYG